MPTETKNVALNRICSGMISVNACSRNSLSLTIEAGEERAERDADAGEAGEERRAEADRDDRQQEQLGRAGARDPLEQRRHEPARDDQHDDDQRDGRAERFRERERIILDDRARRRVPPRRRRASARAAPSR